MERHLPPPFSGNIMIVDDTPANLQVLAEILTYQGYSVRPVPSGKLALQAMGVELPDLVLLDINMPGMNGYEVCQTMKAEERFKHIPVIFLSALSETSDKIKGFAVGGVDYITKPFQFEEVTVRIATHLKLRRLQAQLEQSEEQYRLLTNHMNDLVWSTDVTGTLTFFSPVLTKMLGYTPCELLGQSFATFLPEEASQSVSAYSNSFSDASVDGSTNPLQLISEMIRKDGSKLLVELSVNPVMDETGRYIGLVVVTRDITERFEADQKLQDQSRALAVLKERERMGRELHDSIGQVLSYVNNQAQVIQEMIVQGNMTAATMALGQLSMVANDANTDIREYILDSKTSPIEIGFFEAIQIFLDKFYQISGIQPLLSLPSQINENLISPQARIQLLRIIQEALANTRKYSRAKTVQIVFTLSTSFLQVLIVDDGIGFEIEKIQRKKGLHFGLDIMRERAVEVGGDLEIRSSPGQGTQTIAQLPLVVTKHIALQSLNFFLVDDHPLILEGITNLLSMHNVKVIGSARNGEIAVDQVQALQPDVVLMDLNLPGMNGIEATRRIKKNSPNIQVVFLTLSTDDRDITRAIQAGASGYLLKNEDPEEFLNLLERLVNGEAVIAPAVMSQILYDVSQRRPRQTATESETILFAAGLTEQQIEILSDVVQGKEYKQIASEHHISPHTVKYHFSQILDRLKLTSRSEAVAYSYQIGLVKGRRFGDN